MATLHKFDAQLDFVDQDIEDVITDLLIHLKEELHVRTGEVKAIKEVKSDLNILKAQCSSRLKDHIYSKIRLITPDCDLETIQKQELIEMRESMRNWLTECIQTVQLLPYSYIESYHHIEEREWEMKLPEAETSLQAKHQKMKETMM